MKIDMFFYHKNQELDKKQFTECFSWAVKVGFGSGCQKKYSNVQGSEIKYHNGDWEAEWLNTTASSCCMSLEIFVFDQHD